LVPTKFALKCRPVGPMHCSGLVLDIVGIAAGDQSHKCEEHRVCWNELLEKDIVVCLHMERILVPNFLAGKGKVREEMAFTVNWVMDGVDHCHVVFLLWAYALNGAICDGVLCQVMEVFDKSDPSRAIHKKWHKKGVCTCDGHLVWCKPGWGTLLYQ
jgi:hypothetical protein